MCLVRVALFSALLLAGYGTGSMILWTPRTGECEEMAKAAAYAVGRRPLRCDEGCRCLAPRGGSQDGAFNQDPLRSLTALTEGFELADIVPFASLSRQRSSNED